MEWEALAPTVAVVLKTGEAVSSARVPNMLRTYLRGVPNLLVVSDAPAPPVEAGRPPVLDVLHGAPSPKTNGAPPLALLPATRGWEADCKKNIPALVAAWSRFPSRAYYVLVDDDTWLSLPALGALLARQNASAPLYLGNPYVISGDCCDGLRIEARTRGAARPPPPPPSPGPVRALDRARLAARRTSASSTTAARASS